MRLGRGLFRLQMGEQLGMPNSRPMPGVAAGVSELRVKGEDGNSEPFTTLPRRGVFSFFTPSLKRPGGRLLLKSSWPESA
jgi:hypothetical protein